jgi:hypothetical protein
MMTASISMIASPRREERGVKGTEIGLMEQVFARNGQHPPLYQSEQVPDLQFETTTREFPKCRHEVMGKISGTYT